MVIPQAYGGPAPPPPPPLRSFDSKNWVMPEESIVFSQAEMAMIEAQAATLPTEEDVDHLIEIWRCRKSIRYWVEKYVHIKTVKGYEKWIPYKWQWRILYALSEGRSIITLKSRQVGASWSGAAYALWLCLFFQEQECYFYSINEKKAKTQLNRVVAYLSKLPDWMKVGADPKVLRVDFLVSKSFISSEAAGMNAGRGDTANFIFCDEMGFWQYDEFMWAGIKPAISAGGIAFIVSTPPEPERGETVYGNLLEEINQGISMEDPDYNHWESIKVHYSECRGKDANWVRREKTGIKESVWRREFELSMGEVGYPYFSIDKIQLKPELAKEVRQGPFFIGMDTSELKKGNDLSSIEVMDPNGVQFDCWHSTVEDGKVGAVDPISMGDWTGDMEKPIDDPDGMGKVGEFITRYPGVTFVEKNAQGILTLTAAMRYQNESRIIHGFNTGHQSRAKALSDLALDLEYGRVIITDKYTYNCLVNFVQTDKGKAVAAFGWKDDPVLALALSNQARKAGETLNLSTSVSVGGDARIMNASSAPVALPATSQGVPLFGGEERWTHNL